MRIRSEELKSLYDPNNIDLQPSPSRFNFRKDRFPFIVKLPREVLLRRFLIVQAKDIMVLLDDVSMPFFVEDNVISFEIPKCFERLKKKCRYCTFNVVVCLKNSDLSPRNIPNVDLTNLSKFFLAPPILYTSNFIFYNRLPEFRIPRITLLFGIEDLKHIKETQDRKDMVQYVTNTCAVPLYKIFCIARYWENFTFVMEDYVKTPDKSGDYLIHAAARAGELSIFKTIAEKHPSSCSLPNKNGLYPIHLASENCHTAIVNFLIEEAKIDINQKTDHWMGKTSLDFAVKSGHVSTVLLLRKKGARSNNPLSYASQQSDSIIAMYNDSFVVSSSDLNEIGNLLNEIRDGNEKVKLIKFAVTYANQPLALVKQLSPYRDSSYRNDLLNMTVEYKEFMKATHNNYIEIIAIEKSSEQLSIIKSVEKMPFNKLPRPLLDIICRYLLPDYLKTSPVKIMNALPVYKWSFRIPCLQKKENPQITFWKNINSTYKAQREEKSSLMDKAQREEKSSLKDKVQPKERSSLEEREPKRRRLC